ncbi:polyprenyl synthetase family protein [Aquihabitans sp. G128]|uniref:polyprenyl synthetase family protein n=1 Tax=Aquihabitans sp. G128 TaxID=2849779 RepID=UPI001C250527|nr:polyprenyl synthetase family protein [Aquihabitans sp. G128]QXC59555.1 polyprenyl synthetase family protein [Aquihabitans sp. G128]
MSGPSPTPGTQQLPADLVAIAERVEHRVGALLDEERRRWSALDPALAEPIEALRGLVMAGGKRLRPAFCHWGFVGAGGDPDDPRVVDAGAAFELLQGFALIHDDVMDGSAVRRGGPTVHRQFVERHAESGWAAEGRRFGEGVAVLVGDLALVYADQLLPAGPVELGRHWDELRIELNIGQYLDLLGTAIAQRDRAAARRIARYKSGKYTIERPLQLGATLAGRHDLTEPLSRYGDPLGEAFQLRDDVLGVFGDSARTGKPVGDDLREGKPTLLLAVADEQATPAQQVLLAQVGDPDLGAQAIADLQGVLVATGALAEAERQIAELAERAVAALATIPVTDPARAALRDLAAFVVARDA